MAFEVRLERAFAENRPRFVPNPPDGPSGDIPEFRGGESERVQTVADLLLVAYGRNVGPGDGLNRHT